MSQPTAVSEYQTLSCTVDDDGVATLVLDRPDALNAFDLTMAHELRRFFAEDAYDDAVRAVVVTGAGRAFCAGQDLTARAVAPGTAPPDLGTSLEQHYKPLILALRALPLPVIAAVNGVTAGAGVSFALACDIVVAARSASFVQAFSRLGLVPDAGATFFLTRRLGSARALGIALTGTRLDAQRAQDCGLIWQCVDDAELMPTVRALAARLAAGPTLAFARTKQAIYAAEQQALAQQLDLESELQRELGRSRDYREGVDAFLEKREPRFAGS